jgi:FkbM family methyltransferase
MNVPLAKLVEIIKKNKLNCNFSIIEIGALQIDSKKEPFYELLEYFPSSRIYGFEIEKEVCDKMNLESLKQITYYPYALGKTNEKRKLYITQHPMCSSLYKPNEDLNKLYNNLEVTKLIKESEIETISLDFFAEKYEVIDIDFIKIDVQGSELDIFQGAAKSLQNVLQIVCEVEFIPLYENQPLFGDVCNLLKKNDLIFNKFLGLAGRSLKPIMLNNNPNLASQHMWSDAIFIKNIQKLENISNEKLIKLSLLACVYNSYDLSYYILSYYDKKNLTSLAGDWMNKISKKNI